MLPVTVLLIMFSSVAGAQAIKLGTLAPPGSPWEQSLHRLSNDWRRISRGRVSLRIYAGGVAGDEDDMLRKMRIGQLGAAAISGPGLSQIFPGILAIQMPMLVESDAELDYIIEKMQPFFEEEFAKRGYQLLVWTRAGWAYIFSRDPVIRPEDLRRQKLFVWEANPDEIRAWRELGFNPVALAMTDVMLQLQSGGLDVFISSPLVMASNQFFAVADNMTEMKWAPFIGALLVSTRVWNSIPADTRVELRAAAQKLRTDYEKEFLGADAQAIEVMERNGLKTHPVSPSANREWRELVEEGLLAFFGDRFDISYYETAQGYLEEYRSGAR
jgi:TRAP-type C4-dicarboxylate transport system substrate-binding protein